MRVDEKKKRKKEKKQQKNKQPLTFKEVIKEIVIAFVIAGVILFFVSPTKVKEHSMEPTVNDGDFLLLNKALYMSPEVGDIVVFETDLEDDNGNKMNLIKRVIGVEGDIITISGGKLFRNGSEVKEDYIYETCPGEVYNYKVPEGEVYVLGDHREVSRDSRELGSVDEDTIIGQAFLRVYPFGDFGTLK